MKGNGSTGQKDSFLSCCCRKAEAYNLIMSHIHIMPWLLFLIYSHESGQ